MKEYVFDIETDGLVATKIHCLSYSPVGSLDVQTLITYQGMIDFLNHADRLYCHNGIRYDAVVIKNILGLDIIKKTIDTLPLSWYLSFDRTKHGLESYGEEFGVPKPKVDDWQDQPIEVYINRCEEDVKINFLLWQEQNRKLDLLYGKDVEAKERLIKYLSYKMDMAREQELLGVHFDQEKAQRHYETLLQAQGEKVEALALAMPKVPIYREAKPPAKPYKQDGSLSSHGIKWLSVLQELKLPPTTNVPVNVLTGYEIANPNSGVQVKDWLYSLGWEPQTFKFERNKATGDEKKTPQIRYLKGHEREGELCDSILELSDKDPAVEILDGLTVINHRLGFFKSMLDNATDGKLTASIEGLTNTFRFKHRKPLANIPGVDKRYGKEIRECIVAPEGMLLCGADAVSLEDTTKRHYMVPYDPDYVAEMQVKGYDPHLNLAKFSGKVTQEDIDKHNSKEVSLGSLRKKFKVTNYSATYKIGAAKLARDLRIPKKEAQELLDAFWKRNWSVVKVAEDCEVKVVGPYMWLRNPVSGFWHSLRYDKDRFSTLNQSTGVYCFDTWLYFVRQSGIEIRFQFHDEEGHYVAVGQEEGNTRILKEAIGKANDKLKLNVPLDVDVKYGNDYAETH